MSYNHTKIMEDLGLVPPKIKIPMDPELETWFIALTLTKGDSLLYLNYGRGELDLHNVALMLRDADPKPACHQKLIRAHHETTTKSKQSDYWFYLNLAETFKKWLESNRPR